MKQSLITILFTGLMSIVGTRAFAYDFEVDGIYYTIISFEDFKVEVNGFSSSLSGIVNIPSSVTYSNKYFTVCSIASVKGATNLETVIIPSTITDFGDMAFSNTKIEYLFIPDNVTHLGEYLFEDCQRLKTVRIPSNINYIPFGCFDGCTKLEKVEWHPFGTYCSISGNAFKNCTSLKTFTIPAACSSTGSMIYHSVYDYYISFYGCSSLDSLIIEDGAKKSTIRFGYAREKSTYEYIYWGEFNKSQLKYLYLGKSFESSYSWARTNLKADHVVIGDSVESLSEWPVAKNTLVIGKSLTSVQRFEGESPLEYIKIRSSTPPIAEGFSNKYYMYTVLYVPKGTKAIYESADIWKNFWNIEEFSEDGIEEQNTKCTKPIITYSNGILSFTCETEGATCQYSITDDDIKSGNSNEVQLGVTYNISVYATKAGYVNSDVATATLCWIDVEPKTEGITNIVSNVRARAVLIQSNGNQLTISGADEGTAINVFDISGKPAGSAKASAETTTINTTLRSGDIGIVKIGEKAIKVLMK